MPACKCTRLRSSCRWRRQRYAGRTEAGLHLEDQGRKDLEQAQAIMQKLVSDSPKHRYFRDTLDEARAVLNALPGDTAPIAVH